MPCDTSLKIQINWSKCNDNGPTIHVFLEIPIYISGPIDCMGAGSTITSIFLVLFDMASVFTHIFQRTAQSECSTTEQLIW